MIKKDSEVIMMKSITDTICGKTVALVLRVKGAIFNTKGAGYVDQAIVILIAVVIGALLLGGLYTLFGSTVLPELTRRVQEMFNYEG
jgi:K+-transporting ATPase A subunit